MKIHQIIPGTFKLDGGATFGVIPKVLWQKVYPADENNLCTFALRSLLIELGERKVLIDTGIGNKQDDNFYKHYYREGHHSITKSIKETGVDPEEITDVIITHLHFDHVGGAVDKKGDQYLPAFPNATYHISRKQWDWAMRPNQREKASYLDENIKPLADLGLINFIDSDQELLPGIHVKQFHGHTDGLLIPFISYKDKTLVYMADLVALAAQISSSWVCGYDTRPLISFEERKDFFQDALEKNYYLYFQHDLYTEVCTLKNTDKGIRLGDSYKFDDLFVDH